MNVAVSKRSLIARPEAAICCAVHRLRPKLLWRNCHCGLVPMLWLRGSALKHGADGCTSSRSAHRRRSHRYFSCPYCFTGLSYSLEKRTRKPKRNAIGHDDLAEVTTNGYDSEKKPSPKAMFILKLLKSPPLVAILVITALIVGYWGTIRITGTLDAPSPNAQQRRPNRTQHDTDFSANVHPFVS